MSTVLTYPDGGHFPGRVAISLEDSIPAWPVAPRPEPGALNVLLVVLDDVGFAQFGCFGSDIATPNLDRLAAQGLRYRRFHTTAMCSPTRACLLTGRAQHTAGMGGIADLALGFPGYNGRIPKSCAFVSDVLRRSGYATAAYGKWHLAPSDELHIAASRERWPLGQGFERFYGFLGAESSQYTPDLVIDNSPITRTFEPGYHLSEDIVDRAVADLFDLRAVDPDKPFFTYLAFGACHSPHQVPGEWIEAYRGQFDAGWDEWRADAFDRQKEMGIVPQGAKLSDRPDWVPLWTEMSDDERLVAARMMEVYAGFLTHTDAQLGRMLDAVAASGDADRTVVIALSDNGASAEGGPHGTFNENFLFNGLPHDAAATMAHLADLGSDRTYGHYPWGWAMAGNTPYRRWKRETHQGGIADPLIISHPGVGDAGSVRGQYCHAVDIAATILDAAKVEMPPQVGGVAQEPLEGKSLLPSAFDPAAPEHRRIQYYEQFGCRALYADGFKAVTYHGFGLVRYDDDDEPTRPFMDDRWELYDVVADPAETVDLAEQQPERLRALQDLWFVEASRCGALPLQWSRGFAFGRPEQIPERSRYRYRPGNQPVPEEIAPNTKLRRHVIMAEIATGSDGLGDGIIAAQGGRFGGFALYLSGGELRYAYNFAGLKTVTVAAPLPDAVGETTSCGVELVPSSGTSMDVRLFVDGVTVATGVVPKTALFRFALAGEGLTCGYGAGTPVVDDYVHPARLDQLVSVAIDVSDAAVADVEAAVRHAEMTQ